MAKPKFNEDTLSEKPAIEQLKRLEYTYIHGDELDPELREDCERPSRKEVILVKRLKRKLADINPDLTEESIDKVIRKITHIREENILEANQKFHRYLIAGDSIDQDIGARRQKQTVNFIDFKNITNNEFLVVNQFRVSGIERDRPDIVIFVNGIPLVVIECKSPVAKNKGVVDALDQLIRYQDEIPRLFHTNAFLIGCNLFGAKYGVIGNARDDFQEWKDLGGEKFPHMAGHPSVKEMLKLGLIDKKDIAKDPPMQEILIAGLLKKKNLLDLIRNFLVFDYSREEHRVIKKICRYQQFSAVNKIVKRVTGERDKKGIIWHWQGSGKSLIMLFAATKLRRDEKKLKNPVILIVTDRTKLDRQIIGQFENCNFPNPIRAKSMKELYRLLGSGVGNTIMTTVQKFRKPLEKPLSEAENIIVLTDEAHRTQYGNFALNLRKALPRASFFAFTGTPLNKRDRNTYRHFSPPGERYLDRYDIHQSKADHATVDVKYEGRLANLQVVGNTLDRLLKELFPEKTQKELSEIKRKHATIETLLSAPRRIELVARDIVDHFLGKILPDGFKALVVAADRNAAVLYKKAFDKLISPAWSTIVMSVNNDDSQEWKQKYKRTADEEDHLSGKEVFQNLVIAKETGISSGTPIQECLFGPPL